MDSAATPCPFCRETISPEATLCPHCRSGVLLDVCLDQPVADGRVRYRAGRALAALNGGAPSFSTLQARLGRADGALLEGVTRSVADQAIAVLAAEQVRVRAQPAGAGGQPDVPSRPAWQWIAGIAAMAALAAGGWMFLRRAPATRSALRAVADAASGELSPTDVAERGLAATVALRCDESVGSGFFVARDLVVTNAHVVCPGGEAIRVRTADGVELPGRVERVEDGLDLAVVRVAGFQGEPLPLGDAGTLRSGQPLTMVGSPMGMDFTVHQASVSNVDRRELGLALIQIDGQVNPGNSGGPLLDTHGRAVGVVTLKRMDADGIALAVPINYLHTGAAPPLPEIEGPRSPEFAKMAQRAEDESREMAGELNAAGQRPGLVAVAVAGPTILARVLWPSAVDPGPQTFRFHIWTGSERFCTLDGTVQAWAKVETQGGGSVLPARTKAWLDRNGFASDMYIAQTSLNVTSCPQTALTPGERIELELEGADTGASRAVLE
jgi:serine protease Do